MLCLVLACALTPPPPPAALVPAVPTQGAVQQPRTAARMHVRCGGAYVHAQKGPSMCDGTHLRIQKVLGLVAASEHKDAGRNSRPGAHEGRTLLQKGAERRHSRAGAHAYQRNLRRRQLERPPLNPHWHARPACMRAMCVTPRAPSAPARSPCMHAHNACRARTQASAPRARTSTGP
jgi:hypothetical protein